MNGGSDGGQRVFPFAIAAVAMLGIVWIVQGYRVLAGAGVGEPTFQLLYPKLQSSDVAAARG